MTESIVLDASAALAVLRREPEAIAVLDELRAAVESGRRILVPDLFWLEISNALLRRYGSTAAEVVEAVHELDELDLETIALDRALLLLAVDRSERHALTSYDAVYLAIAEALDADVVTLDARLATAAGARARPVRPIHRGTAESSPTYAVTEPRAPLQAWAGYGAYLAELRAQAG
jgi:predicted nucleic acid-binding protein